MKSLLPLFIGCFIFANAVGQGSNCFQFGYMPSAFKTTEYWENANWPGFSIQTFGIAFSYYRGKNLQNTEPPYGYPEKLKDNGNFFDFGYRYDFRKLAPLKRVFKREVLTPSLGIGIGSYGVKGYWAFQGNLRPGIKITPIPGVSAFVDVFAGYAKPVTTEDPGTPGNLSPEQRAVLTLSGWFIKPAFGIELSANLTKVLGDTWTRSTHYEGGWQSSTYTGIDGNTYTSHYYLPEGNYITDYVTHAKNILNVYGKVGLPMGSVNRAATFIGGGGLALRYGIFAVDLEHTQGRVGYSYGADSWSLDERYQCYWKASRTSLCIGFDFMAIPQPFKLPSYFRLILGARLGVQSLHSVLNNYAETKIGIDNFERQDFNNKFFRSYYYGVELGTLGFGFDYYYSKDQMYKSGFLLTARYMIPLVSSKKD